MDYAAVPNLPTMFFDQARRLGNRPFLWAKRDKVYRPITYGEAADTVRRLAGGLVALGIRPGAVIANDGGLGLDDSGVSGLATLQDAGVAAAAVAAMSARIGDALSTYHDGLVSTVNAHAAAAGVTAGMPARTAARPARSAPHSCRSGPACRP